MIWTPHALAACSLLLLLGGCTSAPGCSGSDTRDLLETIIEEAFDDSFYGKELRPSVEYRVRSIQTLDHDRNVDRYACAATLEISSADGRSKKIEQDFEYDVYLIEDEENDFEISFDDGITKAITRAALAR